MKKTVLKIALLSAVCGLMSVVVPSCKDYDSDIDNLQTQIDGINLSIGQLQEKVTSGMLITGVTANSDGIVVSMSDGKSYTITNGKDGQNGADGKNADVWTIGSDGYWYKNGQKTDFKAIGTDGKNGTDGTNGEQGPQGPQGEPGQNGKDGDTIYYVPNPETGCFDKYENGKKVGETDISWKATMENAMTAVYSGNRLILDGVAGADGSVILQCGVSIGSVAFVPSVMSTAVSYPTTNEIFYNIAYYINDTELNVNKTFKKLNWDKSNYVDLFYRINPTAATIDDNTRVGFINRAVKSRAAGDMTGLLKETQHSFANGDFVVAAMIYPSKLKSPENNIVAAQVWQGQDLYTSDYVYVESKPVEIEIVNPAATTQPAPYYTRNYGFNGNETSDFIQQTCGVTLAASPNFSYDFVSNKSLDLSTVVDLWCNTTGKKVSAMNFSEVKYQFSLPKEYKSNDAQGTNQQQFVSLNDNMLSLNTEWLGQGVTAPAIGRTPVVRVDAMMEDNDGNSRMVASSYIKIEISDKPVVPGQDQQDVNVSMGSQDYLYSNLSNNHMLNGRLSWQDVNLKIYGAVNLSATNFWNYYGGATDQYEVKVEVADFRTPKSGQKTVLSNGIATAGLNYTIPNVQGLFSEILLGNAPTQTSNIQFEINNLCLTNQTYGPFNPVGPATYTITITIPSDNKQVKPNIVITRVFTVLNDYQPYKANPNYKVSDDPITVMTKGKVVGGSWAMQMSIAETFEMRSGRDIFSYFADNNNVASTPIIDFDFVGAHNGIAYGAPKFSDHVVGLTAPLTSASVDANMQYTVFLLNGEKINRPVKIIFTNPFKAGNSGSVSINGNKIGGDSANAATQVKVVDTNNEDIYKWSNNALSLTSLATNSYKLTGNIVSVSYAFNTTETDYRNFVGNLAPGTIFGIDSATGVISFDNLGATLQPSYTLHVKATVTFEDLSQVVCTIPVMIKGVQ